jgi:hypothetical protein
MGENPDFYVSLPRYTILLLVEGDVIIEAPPIARWTIGKAAREVLRYYLTQRDSVIELVA